MVWAHGINDSDKHWDFRRPFSGVFSAAGAGEEMMKKLLPVNMIAGLIIQAHLLTNDGVQEAKLA